MTPVAATNLTLGQLLTSDDITIKRNAMSILKVIQRCDHKNENGACIYCFNPWPPDQCPPHDWDNYGKYTGCGVWEHKTLCPACGDPNDPAHDCEASDDPEPSGCILNHNHAADPSACIFHN